MPSLSELLQLPLHLFCHALATGIDAIVCEAASVALGHEDVQFVLWISFA